MVNRSEAHGKLLVSADKREVLGSLIEGFDRLSGLYYDTHIDNIAISRNKKGEWTYQGDLLGYGRYSYDSNIKDSCSDMFKDIEQDEIDELTNADWSITYDYTDFEARWSVFGHYVIVLSHKAGTDITAPEITYKDYEPLELTAVNLWLHDILGDIECCVDLALDMHRVSRYRPIEKYDLRKIVCGSMSNDEIEEIFECPISDVKNHLHSRLGSAIV